MKKKVKDIIKNFVIDPEWQRNCNIWGPKITALYIDDIIAGNPMPPLLTYLDSTGNEIVIDGKQRVCNLIEALETAYAEAEEYDNYEPEDEDDEFTVTYTTDDVRAIENYQFNIVRYDHKLFSGEDDEIDIQKIVSFFEKVNSRGTKPNAQEIRRALHINTPYIEFVKKIRFSAVFEDFISRFWVTERQLEKMRLRFLDEEFILRALSYYFTDSFTRASYNAKMIDTHVEGKNKKELTEGFKNVLNAFNAVYEGDNSLAGIHFTKKYKGVMPIMVGILGQYDIKDIKANAPALRNFLSDFWNLSNQEIAKKYSLNFASGSAFYRCIADLVLNRLDEL